MSWYNLISVKQKLVNRRVLNKAYPKNRTSASSWRPQLKMCCFSFIPSKRQTLWNTSVLLARIVKKLPMLWQIGHDKRFRSSVVPIFSAGLRPSEAPTHDSHDSPWPSPTYYAASLLLMGLLVLSRSCRCSWHQKDDIQTMWNMLRLIWLKVIRKPVIVPRDMQQLRSLSYHSCNIGKTK